MTTHTITLRDGELDFEGTLLGTATTRENQHWPHDGKYARRGERCKACRWSEASIYKVDGIYGIYTPDQNTVPDTSITPPEAPYLVYTIGGSIVPEETNPMRILWVHRGWDVIEGLVFNQRLGGANREAAEQAAKVDEDIRNAYRLW